METTSQADRISALECSESDRAIDERSALWFEVRHPDGQESSVMVDHHRCSVGGRTDCTIRLAHGEDRVDCLILRGPSGVVARNWSGLTSLNGQSFRDARLQVGDHLEIAGTTVRLLNREPVTPAQTEVLAPWAGAAPETGSLPSTARSATAEQSNGSHVANGNGKAYADDAAIRETRALANERERRRRLIARLRRHSQLQQRERMSWSRARARLERRVSGYARLAARLQDRIHAELRPRLEELEVKRTQLEQRAGDLEAIQAQFNAAHDEVRRRLQHLEDQGEAYKKKQQELDEREQVLAATEAELSERGDLLEVRATELTTRENALAGQADALARQRDDLESERQEISDARSLEDQRRDLEDRAAEIAQMAESLNQKQFFLTEAEQALDVERRELHAREASMNGELEVLRQECTDAVDELKSSREQLVDAQVQLQQERESHSEVTGRFALSEQRARDLESALKDAHTELEQLTSQVADFTERNMAFHHDERQLRQTIEKLESANSAELEQLQASQQELAEQLARWSEERGTWEHERAALQAEIERFRLLEQSLAEEQEAGQQTLQRHDLEWETRRAEWEAERERYDQRIAELAAEVQRLHDAEIARLDDQTVREEPTTVQQPTAPFEQLPIPITSMENPTLSVETLKHEIHEQELLQTISDLEARLEQAEKCREDWDNEREQLVNAYEQQINEITSLIGDLPGQHSTDDQDHVLPPAAMVPPEDGYHPDAHHDIPITTSQPTLQFSATDEESSVDMATILAKFGLSPDDAELLSSEGVAEPTIEPVDAIHLEPCESVDVHEESTEGSTVPSESTEDSDHRESIETYMTRLLGQLPSDWSGENASRAEPVSKPDDRSVSELDDNAAEAPKEESPREKPSLPPKRANPLASTDLSAMRELAITSSRLAIKQHNVRRTAFWVGSGIAKILIAILAGLIISVWGASFHPSIGWVGIVSVPLALYLAYRHFLAPFRKPA